ncbi:unnamed protein product [Clonostachys rosea]|uniref:Uncharacterized protein n=1 Tax=Bionectria ochroleuca TaxID=29856 RepID=A0ABY6UD55_BIOOC|nr:unnamed protein product [Clonostachys rosea]
MDNQRVGHTSGDASMRENQSSNATTPIIGDGYFGLGTMIHQTTDDSLRAFEMCGYDPKFSSQDVHDVLEDFYGPSEKKDQATDPNGDQTEKQNPTNQQNESMSKVSGEDDSMDWQTSNHDDSALTTIVVDPALISPDEQMAHNSPPTSAQDIMETSNHDDSALTTIIVDPTLNTNDDGNVITSIIVDPTSTSPSSQTVHDSPPTFDQDMMVIDSQDELRDGNLQSPPAQHNYGEFAHSHLYNHAPSRALPLDAEELDLSNLYGQAPQAFPTGATNMNEAGPSNHGQYGFRPGSSIRNLNAAFPGLHLGLPRDYFHLVPELEVVLCTICHVACPNTHRHIEQHLIKCHNLPHVRHILTACLALFPASLPEDYSVQTMMDRVKDRLKGERIEIGQIPFVEITEAYECPRDLCNYIDHDRRRVLMHCRNTHDMANVSTRIMTRTRAYSLHMSKVNKMSVRARE